MKQILIMLMCVTALFSLDISKAVELGLAKKNQYMDTDAKINNLHLADDKRDIRLVYIKFLENRENLRIIDSTIKKSKKFKNSTNLISKLNDSHKKIMSDFLDVKSVLELLIDKKIDDVNSVENLNFSQLKNDSLEALIDKSMENSDEINSLESELNEHDSKKSDSSWGIDVSGDVTYGYETAQRRHGRSYSSNEVEVGVSLVLSKNSEHHEDSKIDVAKKRYDLERKKTELSGYIKSSRDEYLKALKEYKLAKSKLKKYDIKNLKDIKELEDAYGYYMLTTEARYKVYRKYARLLHVIEQN